MTNETRKLFYFTIILLSMCVIGYFVRDVYVAKHQGTPCYTTNNYYKKDTTINRVNKIVKKIYHIENADVEQVIEHDVCRKKTLPIENVNSEDNLLKKSSPINNLEFEICYDTEQPSIITAPKKTSKKKPTLKKNSKSKKQCKIEDVGRLGYYGYISPNTWKKLPSKTRDKYRKRFVSRFWSYAHKIGKEEKVNPLIIMSRLARESRWNTSKLANEENNLACIKYREPKGYFKHDAYINGTRSGKYCDDDCNDTFFSWETKSESIIAFCHFVKQTRYQEHLKGKSVRAWSIALCKGKYSTNCKWQNDYATAQSILKMAKELGLKIDSSVKLD